MKNSFEFRAPTVVQFGPGTIADLPDQLADHGPWGLLSSPTVLDRSGIGPAVERARKAGIDVHLLGTISPNPRLSEVDAAVRKAGELGIGGLLAAGGGSVMDAAKLAAVAIRHRASARATLEDIDAVLATPVAQPCRLLVVPTTAGTGAEVSRGAIITDDERGVKTAARGQALVPDEAVIDPELALSLPPRTTAETGFDVVAHAVETYLSRAATPLTDVYALAAVEAVPGALVRAIDDGSDLDARTELALHSWLMGYNLAFASTCLPHRLQYPIGSLTDTSHQLGLAALYPAWAAAVAEKAPERAARLAARMRASLDAEDGADGADGAAARPDAAPPFEAVIRDLLERLGIAVTLRDLGLEPADAPELAARVTGRVDRDPIDPDDATIEALFTRSFGS